MTQAPEPPSDEHGPLGEQWHGDHGELGDGREPRRQPGGVQRTVERVTLGAGNTSDRTITKA